MFFDIGAFEGVWSIENLPFIDKIIAVEANPDTFPKLQENTNFTNKIITENYAVCDSKDEYIDFYKCSVLSTINIDWLTNEKSRFNNYGYEKITCKTITLDKLIEKYGIPSLIKIDVEGGELSCVRSLTQKVDNLCFEWAVEFNDITVDTIKYLMTLGFTNFFLQKDDTFTFRPNNDNYVDFQTIFMQLDNCDKGDWGMIWCK
jgi:FkbM family methyltransferase